MKHFTLSFIEVFIKFDIKISMDLKYLKTNIYKTHKYKIKVHDIFSPSNSIVIN